MTGNAWFADAGYFIAVTHTRDSLHRRARRLASGLRRRLVTTDAVLLEVGNALSNLPLRRLAVLLLRSIRANPHMRLWP